MRKSLLLSLLHSQAFVVPQKKKKKRLAVLLITVNASSVVGWCFSQTNRVGGGSMHFLPLTLQLKETAAHRLDRKTVFGYFNLQRGGENASVEAAVKINQSKLGAAVDT